MKITIRNLRCETVNRIYGLHHMRRHKVKQDIQKVAWAETMSRREKRFEKCRILVTAYFKGKGTHDPDNLYAKPFIDALVQANVIPDDNNSVVESVTLKAVSESKEDYVVIEIL